MAADAVVEVSATPPSAAIPTSASFIFIGWYSSLIYPQNLTDNGKFQRGDDLMLMNKSSALEAASPRERIGGLFLRPQLSTFHAPLLLLSPCRAHVRPRPERIK